ncbi:transposase [Methanocalculus alkaliphilus]|uniref:IS1634 family transposase n=1 Tax=Methanocalculus alkaliphilus TaxID=768730 RepID=UPI00209D4738|nr:IS1634 family transposase [Methanocalculus alkaliphilus]MCP1716378.1 transposase [Methanocalculus alkaliphilus]
MARRKTKKSTIFKKFIQDVELAEQWDVEQTPLLALIVATFLDRLGFVPFINSVVTWDQKQWRVSPGNLAKALIITPFLCIGARIPLYSIHENYQSVDMSLLFEDHVEPEWLTRDAFACLLDRIYDAGCENIFTQIALKVYDTFKIPYTAVFHGDTSTITLYGEYPNTDPDNDDEEAVPAHGHSKDGKPNLKQVLYGMVTDPFGIPLLVTVRSGNQNDSKWNRAIIDSLSDLLKTATSKVTYIADSKLTTAPNILKLIRKGFSFVSVCPANFEKKLAERCIRTAYEKNEWCNIGTYREPRTIRLVEYDVQECQESVCGTICRLLVFRSTKTKNDAVKALEKEKNAILELVKASTKKEFSCEADALKEIAALEKSLKNRIWTVACSLVTKDVEIEKRSVGRPPKNAKPVSKTTVWMIDAGELIVRQERYDLMRWKHESFVLITNVTEEHASAIEILRLYKEQKTVEDNFSVLKQPAMVDTLFLKTPKRIVALITLLSFALLIQVIIRVLVQRNLDAMDEKPGIDHNGKPLARIGLKKIMRFLGYYTVVSKDGEQECICKTKVHRQHLKTWLHLLEVDL